MAEPFPDVVALRTGTVAPTGTPSVTFPAISGLSWELLHVTAQSISTVAAASSNNEIQVNTVSLGWVELANSGGVPSSGDLSWDGSIVFPPNTAVIVTYNAALPANVFGNLLAQARLR